MVLAYLPSPSQGVWHLGPIPIRAYALCIIAGIIVAICLTQRRWTARGGADDHPRRRDVGRPVRHRRRPYLPRAHRPRAVLRRGADRSRRSTSGTAALASGARSRSARSARGSAAAVTTSICSASATPSPRAWCWPRPIGRLGNYFNQELYGGPTTLPWALLIDPAHRPADTPTIGLYHPTFLYESLWGVGVAVLLLWAERRFTLPAALFALYVAAYTLGRGESRHCASTTPTTSWGCASTTGPH